MCSQKTTPDWLRWRTKASPEVVMGALEALYGDVGQYLSLGPRQRGMLGFAEARPVLIGDVPIGRVDYGGESQRGWFRWDVPGTGCAWVRDWDAVGELAELPDTELRRVDLALTTWAGEVTHERVVEAHAAGRFITSGRPPALRQIISSDPEAGRTCYVGKREGAEKFGRFYEKGRMWAQESPFDVVTIEGSPVESIYRSEIELKAVDRPLPWEVVERRDQYFAGSYPFCADILPGVEADILKGRPERRAVTSLAEALEHCRVQFGATLYTALHAYEGDIGAVWDRVVGDRHCRRLLEAGVLMVDHFEGTAS